MDIERLTYLEDKIDKFLEVLSWRVLVPFSKDKTRLYQYMKDSSFDCPEDILKGVLKKDKKQIKLFAKFLSLNFKRNGFTLDIGNQRYLNDLNHPEVILYFRERVIDTVWLFCKYISNADMFLDLFMKNNISLSVTREEPLGRFNFIQRINMKELNSKLKSFIEKNDRYSEFPYKQKITRLIMKWRRYYFSKSSFIFSGDIEQESYERSVAEFAKYTKILQESKRGYNSTYKHKRSE